MKFKPFVEMVIEFLPAGRVCGVRPRADSAMVVFSMNCFGSVVLLAVYYRISPAAADVSA